MAFSALFLDFAPCNRVLDGAQSERDSAGHAQGCSDAPLLPVAAVESTSTWWGGLADRDATEIRVLCSEPAVWSRTQRECWTRRRLSVSSQNVLRRLSGWFQGTQTGCVIIFRFEICSPPSCAAAC